MTPFVGAFFFRPPYSHRNASIGSTRAARHASPAGPPPSDPPAPPAAPAPRPPPAHIRYLPPPSQLRCACRAAASSACNPTDGASPSRPIDFVFGLLSETASAPNRRPPSSAVSALVLSLDFAASPR